ncbi:MBL fold hydrolase [Bordetella genomosp. 9]|uniref:MBL fold hydrolase n=1 Tax=Bordetella genomosp. 9 TaxID=1416803 RepID=A0A261RMV7_9BORD|nr:N-acyl homoserine lactonase family protein [Bordetella genomosp. 9]OZI26002.1 MBL fold hydrolase [Bordetella genomosp. 9]
MGNEATNYELLALKYATRMGSRGHMFLGGDAHDGPLRMDYFIWSIRGGGRIILVDTGFTREVAEKRGRDYLMTPEDCLRKVGIAPESVSDVVITHLHYDHAGNLDKFPNATFHVQDTEVAFATGKYMCFACQRKAFEVDDVTEMVRLVYKDRVRFHDDAGEIAPGVEVFRVGGHTDGLQSVRVRTERGWVVVASDAAHYYENFERQRPFAGVFNVGDMLAGYAKLSEHADTVDHIVAGHDPRVMEIYPPLSQELDGWVVRLDREPRKTKGHSNG